MAILKGDAHSIGTYGYRERDYSLPGTRSVGLFGWMSFEGTLSGIATQYTADPTFEYLYVHPDADGFGNGFSWKDAFTTVGEAVRTLSSGHLITKYIDGALFDATGVIALSGTINKIAVAGGYDYNETVSINGVDDNRINIIGGFYPSTPLPSSYIDLYPSGTNTRMIGTTGNAFNITQPGEYEIRNITMSGYYVGVKSSGNQVYLYNDNFYKNEYGVDFYGVKYDIDNILITNKDSDLSDTSIKLIYSTGNITDSQIISGEYGVYSASGSLNYFVDNIVDACSTGVYVYNNNNNTMTIGENLDGNLFSENTVALQLTSTPFTASHNTSYSSTTFKLDNSTGYYNNGIMSFWGALLTGNLFELVSSELLINNGCLFVSTTQPTGMYIVDSNSSLMLSGNIIKDNPGFVNAASGDFRLDIKSTSLDKAEAIREGSYTHFPINIEAVKISDEYAPKKFNKYKDKIKILGNSIIYINPISGMMDDKVFVNITEKKKISEDLVGISAFNISSGEVNKYPYDYKITSKFNYRKNQNDYYLTPHTIFELYPLLSKHVNDVSQKINSISNENIKLNTKYNYNNIVYDNQHGNEGITNEVFYILEKNNQYLIKSDVMEGKELERYYLARPLSSGINYKTAVYPSGLTFHKKSKEGYEFLTNNFQDDNKVIGTKYITCLDAKGSMKWLPTNIDMDLSSGNVYRDIRGLCIYNNDLYYLMVTSNESKFKYNRYLNEGKDTELIKVDLDNKDDIERIHSGQIIDMTNPASLTVNKHNELIILNYDVDTSGNYYFNKYDFKYDYALINKQNDNVNRVYFREKYQGVNL